MFDGRPRTLFILGSLTLLLELVLIRFLAGTIWNLGYFPNLVLLAVFVGMGLGFVFHGAVRDERSPDLFTAGAWVLLALVAFAHFARPEIPGFTAWGGIVAGEVYYSASPQTAGGSLWMFAVWFLGAVSVFALLSQFTAKVFRLFPPLEAYSLDVGGSCAGILTFMAISVLQLPAWSWFLGAAALFVAAVPGGRRRVLVALPVLACAAIGWRGDQTLSADPTGNLRLARWSPYQKVELEERPDGLQTIFVNGIVHQGMLSGGLLGRSFYATPYRARALRPDLPPYRRVLVIGAGAGNDVAVALMNGVEHVDAIEIDPVIARLGRERHPAGQYRDPRVRLVVTDGRAFLTNAREKYDLIVFALTDSLVKVSPMAQLRLENYLFTREAIQRAYELLTESGDIVIYNDYRSDLVSAKNVLLLEWGTGHSPVLLERQEDFLMFVVGPRTGPPAAPRNPGVHVTTDDWPFPYLGQRGVPDLYVRAMAVVAALIAALALALHLRGQTGGSEGLALRLAFLLMGTAFLLLETKGVIQFSLLFGTTWFNNSLVFLAVLGLVLAANRLAPRLPARGGLAAAYGALMAFCVIAMVVPLGALLRVTSLPLRFAGATVLVFAPIFFANLIFSVAFRDRTVPEHLFGWNLVGATLGGVFEYTSMALGYSALTVLVALFYTLSFALLLAGLRRAPAAAGS